MGSAVWEAEKRVRHSELSKRSAAASALIRREKPPEDERYLLLSFVVWPSEREPELVKRYRKAA